jgi:transposase-like protein
MENKKCKCPRCGAEEKQQKSGLNRSKTQRMLCGECGKRYTPEPKKHAYSEEERQKAIKMYFSGVSGRGVAKFFEFNKGNVYNWLKAIKKTICLFITL